jgi:hypothetical protein
MEIVVQEFTTSQDSPGWCTFIYFSVALFSSRYVYNLWAAFLDISCLFYKFAYNQHRKVLSV